VASRAESRTEIMIGRSLPGKSCKTKTAGFQSSNQWLERWREGIASRTNTQMGHQDIAIANAGQRTLNQRIIRGLFGRQFIAQKSRWCPAHMSPAASLPGPQRIWRQDPPGGPPPMVQSAARDGSKSLIDPLDFSANALSVKLKRFTCVLSDLGPIANRPIGHRQISRESTMPPGMRTKRMPLSNPRAPKRRPGIIQGSITAHRRLIGQKESRLDGLPIENGSDQVRVTHRACIQGEIDTRPTTGRWGDLDRFETWRNRGQWRTINQTQGARLSMNKPCGDRPTLIDRTTRRSARSTIATDLAHR